MCRMLATVGSFDEAAPLVARFHRDAAEGATLPDHARGHRDGWGIVKGTTYLGRSARDAFDDPAFGAAAARVAGPGRGVVVAHIRAASAGAVTLENAHPFIAQGLAFCHNGGVDDIAAPGESDSRAYFQLVLDEKQPPEAALRAVARRLAKEARYASLTALLTDGRSLWGVRKVGEEPGCTADACAAYYSLAVARVGDITVVAQESHVGPSGATWTHVDDGHLLAVRPDGSWETSPL